MSTPGYKTKISVGNTADYATASTWTPFASVTEITPPTLEADDIENSHMLTPNQIKTFLPGWADPGEIEMILEFDKDEAANVYDLFRIPKAYRVEFNDPATPSGAGSRLQANGYIKSIGPEVDREGLATVNVAIKVSGEVDFVPAPAGA